MVQLPLCQGLSLLLLCPFTQVNLAFVFLHTEESRWEALPHFVSFKGRDAECLPSTPSEPSCQSPHALLDVFLKDSSAVPKYKWFTQILEFKRNFPQTFGSIQKQHIQERYQNIIRKQCFWALRTATHQDRQAFKHYSIYWPCIFLYFG